MIDYLPYKGWQVAVASPVAIGLLAVSGGSTLAQTVSPPKADRTLNTEVVPLGNGYRIDKGTLKGQNLFHSFEVFNVPENSPVEFSKPENFSGNVNVFSRITGKTPSSILGLMGGDNINNFFLINPNGILFGPSARLNLKGSFVASTASSILFENEVQFSATNLKQDIPLLTSNVSVPRGLVFEGQSSGVILNTTNLASPDKFPPLQIGGAPMVVDGKELPQNLTLVGGSVISTKQIYAPNGQTSIVTVTTPQTVPLDEAGKPLQNFQPLPASNQLVERVTLPQEFAEAAEKGGLSVDNDGYVALSTSELFVENGDVAFNTFNQSALAGKVLAVSSANDIKLINGQITPVYEQNGTTLGGDIILSARDTIQFQDGGRIVVEAPSVGEAGNITIRADRSLMFNGLKKASGSDTTIFFKTAKDSNLGDLNIQVGDGVSFTNGAYINSETQSGSGNAANIVLNIIGAISFTKDSYINSAVSEGTGKGGDIILRVRDGSISFTDTSRILSNVLEGEGTGGNITITAINGSISFSKNTSVNSGTSGGGDAGDISITALGRNSSITISDDATVNANTSSSGSGGKITVSGQGGVTITGRAEINASTSNTGKAGDIIIAATGGSSSVIVSSKPLSVERAAINANTSGPGDAGNVTLQADRLVLFSNGAEATVRTTKSTGSAGELNVFSDVIRLEDGAKFTATAAFGSGGNIYLQPRNLLLMRHKSLISTRSDAGQSFDGNITIDGGFLVAVPKEDSNILAQAKNKGDIGIIDAQYIFGFTINRDSVEDTSTLIGNGRSDIAASGAVNATVLNVDPTSSLIQLPEEPRSPDLAEGCEAGSAQAFASFTNIGKGGLPPSPDDPLSTELFSVEWSAIEAENKIATTQQGSSNETFSSRSYSAVPSQLTPPCQRAAR